MSRDDYRDFWGESKCDCSRECRCDGYWCEGDCCRGGCTDGSCCGDTSSEGASEESTADEDGLEGGEDMDVDEPEAEVEPAGWRKIS